MTCRDRRVACRLLAAEPSDEAVAVVDATSSESHQTDQQPGALRQRPPCRHGGRQNLCGGGGLFIVRYMCLRGAVIKPLKGSVGRHKRTCTQKHTSNRLLPVSTRSWCSMFSFGKAHKKYEVEGAASGSSVDPKAKPLAPADGQNQEFQPLISDVNVFTDIAIIGGGPTFVAAVKVASKNGGKYSVTAIMGNPFLEWQQACGIFFGEPKRHKEYLCGKMDTFMVPGVEYITDCVTKIDPESKVISFGSRKSTLTYRACIVATGRRLPLLAPRPGDSLLERMAEVRTVGKAISAAKTILLVGAGLIGVEVAADLRLRNRQVERIILLSRTGRALSDTHSVEIQEKVGAKLEAMGVTLMKGTISEDSFDVLTPVLEKGRAPLVEGSDEASIEFDLFIPAFAQGPNTTFLAGSGVLDANGWIESTTCLQSKGAKQREASSRHRGVRVCVETWGKGSIICFSLSSST